MKDCQDCKWLWRLGKKGQNGSKGIGKMFHRITLELPP